MDWQGKLPNGDQVCPGWHHITAPTKQPLRGKAWKAGTQPNPSNKSVFFQGEPGKINSQESLFQTRGSL